MRFAAPRWAAAIVLLGPSLAAGDVELRSPGFPSSKVADDGSLIEPWGSIRLQIIEPQGSRVTAHHAEQGPMPVAVTTMETGPVALVQSAYRAPIWPAGVDVLEAVLTNHDRTPARVQLKAAVPKDMDLGQWIGRR